ncbi:bifunctional RNase H/acid phosphatase [Epidermidibacterium keratini]|uniref:bifunctional RNase H/acid phosphatase n=1 Tax=Epidermidibacterium keratini TaxID=1891644 RepID=UPI0018659A99|nr:bifunctional RNase H/acid phosphatase [Epidermidibacterium keratini]
MSARYIAEADGGSRGNPGVAGYGAVVRDSESGLVLAERAEYIGTATNNVAEYRGLIAALEAARELDIDELDVRMDSKLVVEQMSGRWKIKNATLQPLALQARRLLDEFARVELHWIPRLENAAADALANEAMDNRSSVDRIPDTPPPNPPDPNVISPDPSVNSADPSVVSADPSVNSADPREVALDPREVASARPNLVTAAPGPPPKLSLVLLRHGETEQSLERRFSGRTDLPLTPKGEQQAAAAASRVADSIEAGQISAVLSSPLRRAQQTAQAVGQALGVPVKVDERLREIDFGDWEGLTFDEARRAAGDAFGTWLGSPDAAPPGGESQAQCLERVADLRNSLLREYADQRVLVVTHVTPIKSLLGEALGSAKAAGRINLDLCSLSRIDYYEGRTVVKLVNEISHLGSL